jgi:NTP pyrophosphatase (non-canonical NTP hydrolase)
MSRENRPRREGATEQPERKESAVALISPDSLQASSLACGFERPPSLADTDRCGLSSSLSELQAFQRAADARWGFDWESRPPSEKAPSQEMSELDRSLRCVEYVVLALAGEVGELANAIKKIRRQLLKGNNTSSLHLPSLEEETADIFAYLLKLSNVMGWNLELLYRRKMQANEHRFGAGDEAD